ncbi:CcdC family protein [Bacillus fonticola]|uniref:CcdC family protein n=1 Tax=Bacillus fonticola TaxID=2728853 RepID=UPI0014727281|nr:cytochrome c biogenesis protein CcdC [Bacillus fonticola]
MAIFTSVVAVAMALVVFAVRMRASNRPVTAKKIILPPFFMSTGALMFVFPPFRVTWMETAEAFVVGMLFSIFLIKTSTFEIRGNDIYLKRSKAFLWILLGLVGVRLLLKVILSSSFEVAALSGMFYLLAFGMIVPWRLAMYVKFKKLEQETIRPVPPSY